MCRFTKRLVDDVPRLVEDLESAVESLYGSLDGIEAEFANYALRGKAHEIQDPRKHAEGRSRQNYHGESGGEGDYMANFMTSDICIGDAINAVTCRQRDPLAVESDMGKLIRRSRDSCRSFLHSIKRVSVSFSLGKYIAEMN